MQLEFVLNFLYKNLSFIQHFGSKNQINVDIIDRYVESFSEQEQKFIKGNKEKLSLYAKEWWI